MAGRSITPSPMMVCLLPPWPTFSLVVWPQASKKCCFDPWVKKIPWRRAWQPTPVFLSGESHRQRSLAGYSPWGHKDWDMTKQRIFSLSIWFSDGSRDCPGVWVHICIWVSRALLVEKKLLEAYVLLALITGSEVRENVLASQWEHYFSFVFHSWLLSFQRKLWRVKDLLTWIGFSLEYPSKAIIWVWSGIHKIYSSG